MVAVDMEEMVLPAVAGSSDDGGDGGGGPRRGDASGSQEVLSTTCVQLLVPRLWRPPRVEAV